MRVVKPIVAMLFICLFTCFALTTVDAFGGPVTSPFGMREHPIQHRQILHNGVDIGLDEGTELPAIATGEVVATGYDGGYGYWLQLKEDGANRWWLYAHLSGFAVGSGTHVTKGRIVAYSGSTGASTGGHLHLTLSTAYDERGNEIDPVPYVIAAGWDLSGDLSSNSIAKEFMGILPDFSLDYDYTQYFKPAETLAKAAKQVFDLFVKAMDHIKDNLLPILVALCMLDFLWYLAKTVIEVEPFAPERFIPKLIRYGFFVGIWNSWHMLFSNIFVPLFEGIGSLYGGTEITTDDLLAFDKLYNALSSILANYMKLHWSAPDFFGLPGFLISNILVLLILAVSILMCLYIVTRIAYFYVVCVFGVLGLPVSLIPFINLHAGHMLGGVFRYAIELGLLTALFAMLVSYIESVAPIPKGSNSELLFFLIQFTLCSLLLSDAGRWGKHFTGRVSI